MSDLGATLRAIVAEGHGCVDLRRYPEGGLMGGTWACASQTDRQGQPTGHADREAWGAYRARKEAGESDWLPTPELAAADRLRQIRALRGADVAVAAEEKRREAEASEG